MLRLLNFNHRLRVGIPDTINRILNILLMKLVHFYTAGSKKEEGVGAAVFCNDLHLNLPFFGSLTNSSFFQAGILAIQKEADSALNSPTAGKTINTLADS